MKPRLKPLSMRGQTRNGAWPTCGAAVPAAARKRDACTTIHNFGYARALVLRLLPMWVFCLVVVDVVCCADSIVDLPSATDPALSLPEPVILLSPKLKSLWHQALERREADLQRQVAEAVARAHREGVQNLQDMIVPLLAVLKSPNLHSIARRAVAQALATMDAQNAAPAMFRHLGDEGLAYAQVVEPALARWNYEPVRQVWFNRLSQQSVRRGLLVLAIRGAHHLEDKAATRTALLRLAESSKSSPQIRLEAARALATVQDTSLVEPARRLASREQRSDRNLIDRIVAASMLNRHSDDTAKEILLEFAVDPNAAVASIALNRLLELDAHSVVSIADRLLSSRHAELRGHAVRALAAESDMMSTWLLAPLLDDPHIQVRTEARVALQQHAADTSLQGGVWNEALRMLDANGWRGHEQAALLLGSLAHKPAADRLLERLESERPEVATAAAWALRKLAIADSLPALLDKARRATQDMQRNEDQLRQLIYAFGQLKYREAVPLLRQYTRGKNSFGWESREAAIWALGYIDEGQGESAFDRLLVGRLSDLNLLNPEAEQVRRMAAISLGRMNVESALTELRKFYHSEGPNSPVGLACRWAVQRMTGESLLGPQPVTIYKRGWFLEPLN